MTETTENNKDVIENDSKHEVNAHEADKKPDLIDLIIEAFTVKPRVNFIDYDKDDAVISYQQSENRLIAFGTFMAFLMAILVTSILISMRAPSETISKTQILPKDSLTMPIPRILSMNRYEDGHMQFYDLTKNLTFAPFWNIQVPKSKTYFPYYRNHHVYIIYSDTRKSITKIDIDGKRIVKFKESQIPSNFESEIDTFGYGSSIGQFGRFYWVFGGVYPSGRHNMLGKKDFFKTDLKKSFFFN